ncbi:Sodium channel protein [Symbiodinium microadriaticum]|uniref:Sodium channel protein n=1 Tax=Symbiodinium microadriaticum TaxID=2951 RepID=A0A1Q9DM20_SYMMI|nr:Sodium channel protein [Symbiodinium microadriaticum]
MVEDLPITSTEQRLKDQHTELLLHLDGWFERVETTISRLQTTIDHAPVTHLLPSHPRFSVSSRGSQSKESKDTIGDPSNSFLKEKAPSMSVRSEPSLRNSRTSMKRLDSYTVAVKKSSRISESFKKVWTKDGSHTSMQVHRQNPSRCKKLWASLTEFSEKVIHSQWANLFFGAAILSNSLFLGIQLQYRAQNPGPSDTSIVFFVIHTLYAVLFTVEVLLRLLGEGFWDFFFSSSWTWNWLDVFVVISSWAELSLEFASPTGSTSISNSNLRLVRVLRVGRLLRVLRVIRVARVFKALRTLVRSLMDTSKQLVWAMLLLTLIMYMFSIVFTDIVLDHLEDTGEQDTTMEKYFGTLYDSFFTLFRAILNGISWYDAADALRPINLLWVQWFHFYIAFCQFAVLNVMTGVFCNSAIKAAERDHETVVQSLMQNREDFRAQVSNLFYRIDERGLGKITLTELEKHLDDEAVKAFFESLEIGAVDAWTLFLSLDIDGDNLISIDEFMERCVQLRGPARSVDLYAIRRLNVKIRDEMRFLEDQQHRIMAHLGVKHEHQDAHEIEPTVFI